MHARVSYYDANDPDQGVDAFKQVTGRVEQMSGNQGGMLLIDRDGMKAISITFWDSEENLTASAEQANQVRQEAAEHGGLGIRNVESYEVAVEFGR